MTENNGWESSAAAWIESQGEHGDFGRRYVLDPIMLRLALARTPRSALDVGCGEGRFCRMLRANGIEASGIDPTRELIAAARKFLTVLNAMIRDQKPVEPSHVS